MQSRRWQYLEGLRGIAAMQVVLMHFVIGFLPATNEHIWPPLRVLYDGHTAVYLFFLISGTVLTPSFARPGAFVAKLMKRVVRLGIPVAAAAAIATLLLALLPDAHRHAASLTGSAWLAMDPSGAPTFTHLARELGLDSLLLGYRETTLFAPLASQLPPMELSLDAPFWSLHLELYGSLLVLCLVSLRVYSAWLHRFAIIAAAVAFGTHPMFLFVLGHLLHPSPVPRSGEQPAPDWIRGFGRGYWGPFLLLLGIALCATKDWRIVEMSRVVFSHIELAYAPNLYQFQSQLGAVALYIGVLLTPVVWPILESRPCRHLGRLSFSIYLLHFPILFTVVCGAFIPLVAILPSPAALAAAFALFLGLTLLAAIVFERLVDRPAIALSRWVGVARLEPA